MIEHFFPTPVLQQQADPIKFSGIQNEIKKMCSALTFEKNNEWVSNNHKLSDITFKSNIIEEHNLVCLKAYIKLCMDEYLSHCSNKMDYNIIQSWMTKTSKGEITTVHNHGMFDIAGVYYYKTNENDGAIKFLNPNAGMTGSQVFVRDYQMGLNPKEGMCILFPAWLNHTVEMNKTDNERMSLAFNINIDRTNIYRSDNG
jgi:uncharacterized protein (TIGR02466 family)